MNQEKLDDAFRIIQTEFDALVAKQVLSEAAIAHLRQMYTTIWIESHYDAYSEKSYEIAVKLWPHIEALNKELKFK